MSDRLPRSLPPAAFEREQLTDAERARVRAWLSAAAVGDAPDTTDPSLPPVESRAPKAAMLALTPVRSSRRRDRRARPATPWLPKVVIGVGGLVVLALLVSHVLIAPAGNPPEQTPGQPDANPGEDPQATAALHLVVQELENRTVRHRLVTIDNDGVAISGSIPSNAPRGPLHQVSARSGEGLCTVRPVERDGSAEGQPAHWQVLLQRRADADDGGVGLEWAATSAPFTGQPASMMMVGQQCFVSTYHQIWHIDFTDDPAQPRELIAWPIEKACDFFIRDGQTLLAIDDIAHPRFAVHIGLDERDRPTGARLVVLPMVINGKYTDGAAADGRLVLVADSGSIRGSFQELKRVDYGALPEVEDVRRMPVLGVEEMEGGALIYEMVPMPRNPMDDPDPERLIAGDVMSHWYAVAMAADRVLLAAGSRGILVLPGAFTREDTADMLPVGDCRDVMVEAGRIFALVAGVDGDPHELVELGFADGELRELRRHALPSDDQLPYLRFVR